MKIGILALCTYSSYPSPAVLFVVVKTLLPFSLINWSDRTRRHVAYICASEALDFVDEQGLVMPVKAAFFFTVSRAHPSKCQTVKHGDTRRRVEHGCGARLCPKSAVSFMISAVCMDWHRLHYQINLISRPEYFRLRATSLSNTLYLLLVQ
ncbi:hypothetical protein BJ165DRAFT_61707 [Panaeolus papilionaceus]|nr:hypothetical protein BJ165DRAFT_61707 [Panaeolus papilionaceus]